MGILKSPTGFYTGLMQSILASVYGGRECSHHDLLKDVSYIFDRVNHEGLKFLTVTLPKLGKAIDRGLETGHLVLPVGFKRASRKSRIPAFMQGIFRCVFHEDGTLKEEPDSHSIQDLRQVLFLLYKLELPYSEKEKGKVLDNFEVVEAELSSSIYFDDTRVLSKARRLIHSVLKGFDPKDIVPAHGPGAVATGEKGDEKWTFARKYTSLHQCYPYYDYFIVGRGNELCDRLSWYKGLVKEEIPCAKVILVPKDSRGPRLISEEPLEIQYIQQGLLRKLVPWIENHPLTRGVINFTDQSLNQRLALESSTTRECATLDLKEASDRIRMDLVEDLFPKEFVRHIKACRSTHTELPCGKRLPLSKFAPMGSALCFPVMALTLWAICRAYLQDSDDQERSSVHSIPHYGTIAVYGDDLVVPTRSARTLVRVLERHSLRVNSDKSFVDGYFRESCGVDAYKGVNVTPGRLRKPFSAKSRDTSFLANSSSLANFMFKRGYWLCASYLWSTIESVYGKIPYGTPSAGYVCREVDDVEEAERLNLALYRQHRYEEGIQVNQFRVFLFSKETKEGLIDGWPRALRGILSPGSGVERTPVSLGANPFVTVTSFSSLVKIKRGWSVTL
jgi:hypothetical protein